jgi:hypothetical protein
VGVPRGAGRGGRSAEAEVKRRVRAEERGTRPKRNRRLGRQMAEADAGWAVRSAQPAVTRRGEPG